MKITIEIDEQEIAEEVKALIIRNAVKKVEEDLYHDPYGTRTVSARLCARQSKSTLMTS